MFKPPNNSQCNCDSQRVSKSSVPCVCGGYSSIDVGGDEATRRMRSRFLADESDEEGKVYPVKFMDLETVKAGMKPQTPWHNDLHTSFDDEIRKWSKAIKKVTYTQGKDKRVRNR